MIDSKFIKDIKCPHCGAKHFKTSASNFPEIMFPILHIYEPVYKDGELQNSEKPRDMFEICTCLECGKKFIAEEKYDDYTTELGFASHLEVKEYPEVKSELQQPVLVSHGESFAKPEVTVSDSGSLISMKYAESTISRLSDIDPDASDYKIIHYTVVETEYGEDRVSTVDGIIIDVTEERINKLIDDLNFNCSCGDYYEAVRIN